MGSVFWHYKQSKITELDTDAQPLEKKINVCLAQRCVFVCVCTCMQAGLGAKTSSSSRLDEPMFRKKKKKRTLASLDSLVFGEPKQQQENDVLTHLYRLLEILTFISHFLS